MWGGAGYLVVHDVTLELNMVSCGAALFWGGRGIFAYLVVQDGIW